MNSSSLEHTREILETIYNTYHHPSYIPTDPIYWVHQFTNPPDQEVVAFLSALMAYGRVAQILKSLEKLFSYMGHSPYRYLLESDFSEPNHPLCSFKHRFTKGSDLILLFSTLQQKLQKYSSLQFLFLSFYDGDIQNALIPFVEALESPLLPNPKKGSACKRLHLFLRWMVRRADGIDLGLWKELSPPQLFIPLDTHVARISQQLGLTQKNSPSWGMVLEVTKYLREINPSDPIKYDFSLMRAGLFKSV